MTLAIKGAARTGMAHLLLMMLLCGNELVAGTDSRLADAVKNKDLHMVRTLLERHLDANEPQSDGSTALHWAAHWDDLDTASLLIGAGENVGAVTDLGVTPLYLAAENGSAAMTERLLAAGADPNVAPETGITPLMMAARAGSVDTVKVLLKHHADINAAEKRSGQTALMWAVAQRHSPVVQILVENGADIRARTKTDRRFVVKGGPGGYDDFTNVEYVETGGNTALLLAAAHGDIESARHLLEFAASVDDIGADGNSALVVAAHSGQGAFAGFLLERGANPNANQAGYTVLHAAVLRDDLDLIKSSIAHGADLNARLSAGTPYRRQSADFYLSSDLIGATPLILAAKYASPDIVQVLTAAGADLALAADDGTTALIAAADATDNQRQPESTFVRRNRDEDERLSLESVQALLDSGADVNAVNGAGNSALHVAVSGRSNPIVQLLAERGARLEVKNKRGQTPLAIAASSGRRGSGGAQSNETAELLRKLGAKE